MKRSLAPLLDELSWRGLIQQHTPQLPERLDRGPVRGYVGFDPTARSLQVGNLVPIMLLAHLQRAGGEPIVVIGGGTGLVGDPSGKTEERPLLDEAVIAENIQRQRTQFQRFLDFTPGRGELVDNADWLRPLNLVEFLRDIGKHFTASYILQKESVKARVRSGISFTELSYLLLQAYDFLHLYRTKQCELQLGGSDQWGNITAGTELIRRVEGEEAHGLAAPLLTTASGRKFGKTEAGSVWLDPDMTEPWAFHQFWINTDDRDVESHLKALTLLERSEIADLMSQHHAEPEARIPHHALAREITQRVHGDADAIELEARRRFGRLNPRKLDPRDLDAETLQQLAASLPSGPLPASANPGTPIVELIASCSLVASRSEARRQIEQGGILWNGQRVTDWKSTAGEPLAGGHYWATRGKKKDYLFTPST